MVTVTQHSYLDYLDYNRSSCGWGCVYHTQTPHYPYRHTSLGQTRENRGPFGTDRLELGQFTALGGMFYHKE
eukprot:CFRG1793T1